MFGLVPVTRPNTSESHSEISTRVPFCIAGGGGGVVTEVIQRGVKQRLLKYLAASGSSSGAPRTRRKSSAAGTEGRWACHPGLQLAVFLLSTCKQNRARY